MKYFILAGILLVLASCNTLKPIYKDISVPDYNYRTTVSGAGYIKKSNAVGWSFQIAGPIAGAYLGYESDLIKIPDGNSKKSVPIANAAIGAIIGYSIPFTLNLLSGKNKKSNVIDVEKWVKKKYPNYLVLKRSSSSNFVIIPKSVESTFEVRNIQDVRDFVYLFPKSKYNDDIFSKSVSKLKRYDLPELISLIPNSIYLNKAKIKYYNSSSDATQLKDAISKYPSQKKDCNDCGIINNLYSTASKDDLIYLAKEFPNSNCINNLYDKLISQTKTVDECIELVSHLPILKQKVSARATTLSNSIADCKKAYDYFPSIRIDLEKKVMSIASTIEELGLVYNSFSLLAPLAEQKAYFQSNSLNSKKEFIKYFKHSSFYSIVLKEVEMEELKIEYYKRIATKIGNSVLGSYLIRNYRDLGHSVKIIDYSNTNDYAKISVRVKLKTKFDPTGLSWNDVNARYIRTTFDVLFYNNGNIDKTNVVENGAASGMKLTNQMWDGFKTVATDAFNTFRKDFAENYNEIDYNNDEASKNTPCYEILDDYGYLIDNTKRYYKVKCKNGKEWTITYNSKSSKPYTKGNLDGIFFSYETFQKAAKAACGCQ